MIIKENINILLIEDNKGDIRLLQEILSLLKLNVNLSVAENGLDAIQLVLCQKMISDNSNYDLILLDINIPIFNGLEVLKEIRNYESIKNIPVVILTSSRYDTDVYEGYKRGANAVLFKTTELLEYIEMISSVFKFWLR